METLTGKPVLQSRDSKLAKILQGLDILAKTTPKQEPQHRLGTQVLTSNGSGLGTLYRETCFKTGAFCLPTEGFHSWPGFLGKVIILLLLVYSLLGSSQMEI